MNDFTPVFDVCLCLTGSFLLWGQTIQVDWAEPERDVDEEVLQRVKVLYASVILRSIQIPCFIIVKG